MADGTGVLILGDATGGELGSTTAELLAAGQRVAGDLGEELSVALLGDTVDAAAQQAIAHGAQKVYAVNSPLLANYNVDISLAALESLVNEVAPRVILVARTNEGRELAPRLAFRLGVGLAQDCLEVSVDPGEKRLLANRPVYGGNAIAVVSCDQTPQIAAVRPKAYEPTQADASRQGEVVSFPVELDASVAKTQVVDTVIEEAEGVKLEDATIVVSGGRGLGGPEPFAHLEELAKIMGGTVGASRAAVDSGWVPSSYQVGLTGKTITPDLYITVAISGASQHMAGCSGAKVIVAINKDAEANIFKEARYGVVGDWETVLPALTAAVKELSEG
ncbi:MAG: electron transfer flavoprotein subunit alpha/FixB family protein [SAR202 cluster bacterium]|nr:electron transfer flavoprotein subunit alpha [Chloroflexota bacterium]MQF95323.1 electron transfer flavoprotein subunit alpha/FixB family protein [SAR202 cluster bacterium]MQG35022.1 electron transfer flavoprotein subunit alpha/FixB family protein [SAR202 cluster bacterium]HAA95023.1 electron transfer flavoprotein subunit alpha [Dehalococcoidia bacterium]HCP23095.1 electron transfer flavoprotein subunit alpha [Dehalococcoidia bacterium]|tara:strand:- start:1341 stop:2339 length:999 start_codon:yes stop_codon:yes gene_type:complete